MTTFRRCGQLAAGCFEVLQQHEPDCRHRGGAGDLVAVEQFEHRRAVELRARHHQGGAGDRSGERHRPAIGMEHGHDRHHHVARRIPFHVAGVRHQPVQHVRAVRIEHALRVSGRARGVAHAGGGIFVEPLPGKIAVGLRDPFLVGDRVSQRGSWHVRRVGQHDIAFDRRELVRELFQQRDEGQVGQHHAVFGVIDDPDDLVGKQPRIDRVIDGADPHDAVPGLQMAPGIPGQRRDPVAEHDAVSLQPLREPQGAGANLGIGRLVDGSFNRARYDRPTGVIRGGVVDNAMAEQRPILHQPEHGVSLRCFLSRWSA